MVGRVGSTRSMVFTVPGDHMHHITRNELAYLANLYVSRESPVTTVKGKI